MKKQILTLIIGILIGAIITTGVFLVLKNNDRPSMGDFDRSNFPMRQRSNSDEIENESETETETKVEENK